MDSPRLDLSVDLVRRACEIAEAGVTGVLLEVEVERISLEKARAIESSREAEKQRLLEAWTICSSCVPPNAAGKRTMWDRFAFVLEGDRDGSSALARDVLKRLRATATLRVYRWHFILTQILAHDPRRTFVTDPGYDLRAAHGRDAIAWVEPYADDDCREVQRYPRVTFIDIDAR